MAELGHRLVQLGGRNRPVPVEVEAFERRFCRRFHRFIDRIESSDLSNIVSDTIQGYEKIQRHAERKHHHNEYRVGEHLVPLFVVAIEGIVRHQEVQGGIERHSCRRSCAVESSAATQTHRRGIWIHVFDLVAPKEEKRLARHGRVGEEDDHH